MFRNNHYVVLLMQILLIIQIIYPSNAHIERSDKYRLTTTKSPPVNNIVYNTRPIIGILSQELNTQIYKLCTLATYRSYIAASYVKYIESAGARVVPIKIGQPDSYYEDIVNSVNGIVLPGGSAVIYDILDGYGTAAAKLYDLAIEKKVPLWGICLGFEAIIYNSLKKDIRVKCNIRDKTVPLKFLVDYTESRLFKTAPFEVIKILKTQSITANTHTYCISPKIAKKHKLNKKWLILSMNKIKNHSFISAIESKKHKIWGVQFHPEKNIYEWSKSHFDHSIQGIIVSQYFANFFVNECRKNNHTFTDKTKEANLLIYNYSPIYTSKNGCPFEQCYVFL